MTFAQAEPMPSANRIHFTPSARVHKRLLAEAERTGRTPGNVAAGMVSYLFYLIDSGAVVISTEHLDDGMDNHHGGKRISRKSPNTSPE